MTTRQLVEAVKTTIADGGSIRPQGGGTKAHFLTMPDDSVVVSTQAHTGIVHYHADELVVRVKAGTLLSDLTEILAAKGQYLPAEPPAYGNAATIGGAVAAGLSGHGRPYAGGLRDFVLGLRMILPSGEVASFGGDVMKNVAGYDVSRLQVGAMGSLGLILDIALKVIPKPLKNIVYNMACEREEALRLMQQLGKIFGVSALSCREGKLWVRLSGSAQSCLQGARQLPSDFKEIDAGLPQWEMSQFSGPDHLWRWDGKPTTALVQPGVIGMDWGGALRWLAIGTEGLSGLDRDRVTWVKRGLDPLPKLTTRQDGVGLLQERVKRQLDPNQHFINFPSLRLSE
jgi:glycolate oxidase FAD binding subunit